MTDTSSHRVRITPAVPSAALSRARKQFNTLIKKLETERQRLADWHDKLPQLNQLSQEQYMPLVQDLNAHRKQLVLLFDAARDHASMTGRDKEKLADLACSIAMTLLDNGYDAELAAIVEKYTGEEIREDGEDMSPAELAAFKRHIEEMFGVDLGDAADLTTQQALLEALEQKMREARQQHAPEPRSDGAKPEQANQEEASPEHAIPERLSKRQLQQQADAARLQLSVREIYRKLVSSLHPDREPDPDERQRKTELMQRVNVAYEKNDLLGLLELQLEVDHIDQDGLNNLDEDRVTQYNKILRGQVGDLEREIRQLEESLQHELQLVSSRRPTPSFLMAQLKRDIAEVRRHVAETGVDLVEFKDRKRLKAWLKSYRIAEPEPGPSGFDGW